MKSIPSKNAEENKKTAVSRGALLAVVQAMCRNADSYEIQGHGIAILANISRCKLENFKPDIIAVGGLKACLEAMKRCALEAVGCRLIESLWSSVSTSGRRWSMKEDSRQ